MDSLALRLDDDNSTTIPLSDKYCYQRNLTGSFGHYDDIDGGVPQIFGLNCLGWVVSIEDSLW